MTIASLLCFLLAGLGALWLAMVWRGMAQDWMPDDLKSGRLVAIEKDLHADDPFPVVGRPDQVYRLANGLHAPVELKNRDSHSVYESDIAEISLRAWLLRKNGQPTAGHGYVVINNRTSGQRKAIRVALGGDAFCEALIGRYVALVEGRARPNKSPGRKCRSCGHLALCQPSPTH